MKSKNQHVFARKNDEAICVRMKVIGAVRVHAARVHQQGLDVWKAYGIINGTRRKVLRHKGVSVFAKYYSRFIQRHPSDRWLKDRFESYAISR